MFDRASEYNKVWKNYNSFHRKPNTVDEIECNVCGTVCNVERNEVGPTSFASAMAKQEIAHDHFTCPHNDEGWHWRALAMTQEVNDTCSPSLRAIIQQDIDDTVYDGLKR